MTHAVVIADYRVNWLTEATAANAVSTRRTAACRVTAGGGIQNQEQ
ncbi:MAG: hypothetical protein NTU61_04695 [Candidatus Altiarchaeota archaeon]|nr:hypothetical protein [Candidatus Altiarchaeota archaeon]